MLEIPKLTYKNRHIEFKLKKNRCKKKKKKKPTILASQQTSGFKRFLLVSVLLVEINFSTSHNTDSSNLNHSEHFSFDLDKRKMFQLYSNNAVTI